MKWRRESKLISPSYFVSYVQILYGPSWEWTTVSEVRSQSSEKADEMCAWRKTMTKKLYSWHKVKFVGPLTSLYRTQLVVSLSIYVFLGSVVWSRPPICPSVRTSACVIMAPIVLISAIVTLNTFRKTCQTPVFLKIGQNIGHFIWRPKYVLFLSAKKKKFATKHFYAQISILILFTLKESSIMQTEHNSVFPSQQWSGKRATMLRYTNMGYLVPVSYPKRKTESRIIQYSLLCKLANIYRSQGCYSDVQHRFFWITCETPTPSIFHIHKVVQIWPGQTVTCLHTNRPGHIWTTLYK
jgi:hypothetical protein